jgi:preprotein translocase subunit SecG
MLTVFITIIHVVVCFFLMIVVLLQSGQAADLAGAFGGMGSQTAFGPRGSATVLSKATTFAAALFMITSLTLAILANRNASTGGERSVLDKTKAAVTKTVPAAPAPAPIQPGKPLGNVSVTPEGGNARPVPVTPAAPAKK